MLGPRNPVIHEYLRDEFGKPIPVENCSLNAWELLKGVNPDEDIRVASPGFVQELNRMLVVKGLHACSERDSSVLQLTNTSSPTP